MSAANQPRQLMWEFTPPHGIVFQQWQLSIRLLFKDDRLDEMLAWLRIQLQLCEEAAEKGLMYNKQPEPPRPQGIKNRDKQRPVAVHGNRRREPRRGEDDAADPDSPPPLKKDQQRQVARQGGNVQSDAGPMQSMTPGMARPVTGATPAAPAALSSKEDVIATLKAKLAELEAAPPEAEEEQIPDTQPRVPTEAPPPFEAEAPVGPKVYRHRWSAGRYDIDPENTCAKCGAQCTGVEELCPVP